jgi:NMT1-like family
MRIRNRTTFGFVFGVALLLAFAVAGSAPSVAEELGLAVKKPVVAAACKLCPWGAIADVLKEALKPQGYDLQICYTCSRGNNPRYVVGTMTPPQTDSEGSPPPPNHPIEFGITSGSSVQWMYEGSHDYAKDGGHKELRLIARVDVANYTVMMVKASTGITDLRQIKEKRLPVRIITTESTGNMPILKYYGNHQEGSGIVGRLLRALRRHAAGRSRCIRRRHHEQSLSRWCTGNAALLPDHREIRHALPADAAGSA